MFRRLRWELLLLEKFFTVTNRSPKNLEVVLFQNVKVTIELDSRHPFVMPKHVSLGDKEYLFVARKMSVNNQSCMCCKSILCDWNPSYTLVHLLREIQQNYERKMSSVWLIFAKVVERNISSIPQRALRPFLH